MGDQDVGVAVIGGGNMGAALLGGMVDSGEFDAADLAVVEVLAGRRAELAELLPDVAVHDAVPSCASAVIAVKPGDATTAVGAAVDAGATRVLSIAAGVRLDAIEAAAGPDVAVIRAMPNTPALVGSGTSAIAGGAAARDDDLVWAERVLGSVGIVERVPESMLDVVTGLAGSGPAYVFLVAEALIEGAVAEGLPRPTAERFVAQVLLGSSQLLVRDRDPARLRAMVTSPGGTTAAGLAALEERATRAAFAAAVKAATGRSRELG